MQSSPPPSLLRFEVIPEPSALKGAYITEADSDDDASVNNYPMELYDMFEVFTAKNAGSTTLSPDCIDLHFLSAQSSWSIQIPSHRRR
jgi:hypothetical protein